MVALTKHKLMPHDIKNDHKYVFKFNGKLDTLDSIAIKGGETSLTSEESVHLLNNKSDEIGDEISKALQQSLPPDLTVQVTVRFHKGSIEFVGIVEILDWMGRIVATKDFIEMTISLIRFVSGRVIRNKARQNSIELASSETKIDILPYISYQREGLTDILIREVITRQDDIRKTTQILSDKTKQLETFSTAIYLNTEAQQKQTRVITIIFAILIVVILSALAVLISGIKYGNWLLPFL